MARASTSKPRRRPKAVVWQAWLAFDRAPTWLSPCLQRGVDHPFALKAVLHRDEHGVLCCPTPPLTSCIPGGRPNEWLLVELRLPPRMRPKWRAVPPPTPNPAVQAGRYMDE